MFVLGYKTEQYYYVFYVFKKQSENSWIYKLLSNCILELSLNLIISSVKLLFWTENRLHGTVDCRC